MDFQDSLPPFAYFVSRFFVQLCIAFHWLIRGSQSASLLHPWLLLLKLAFVVAFGSFVVCFWLAESQRN
jgi:hypothetical protein